MYYDKIRHRHSQVLAATGLTPAEFDALLITFKYHWDEYYSHFTLEGKVRQRISYNSVVSDSGQNAVSYTHLVILQKEQVVGIDICGECSTTLNLFEEKRETVMDSQANKELLRFIRSSSGLQ